MGFSAAKGYMEHDSVAGHINREGWKAVGERLRCAHDMVAAFKGLSVSAVTTYLNDK